MLGTWRDSASTRYSRRSPSIQVLWLAELLGECERLEGLGVEGELIALGTPGVVEVERNSGAEPPEGVARRCLPLTGRLLEASAV